MLQCVAVFCSELRYVAVKEAHGVQCVAVCCSELRCVAVKEALGVQCNRAGRAA